MKKRFVVKSYYTLKTSIYSPELDLSLFNRIPKPEESKILGWNKEDILDCNYIIDKEWPFPPLIKELENKKVKEAYSVKSFAGMSIVIFEDNSFISVMFGSGLPILRAEIGKIISIEDF